MLKRNKTSPKPLFEHVIPAVTLNYTNNVKIDGRQLKLDVAGKQASNINICVIDIFSAKNLLLR